ncbi:MAG: hypothetical protein M3R51_05395 [Candidatus Eremiobacteraeota bacterium]|nr:hypothetical protein [Candidatus Eremiobacteraeota bacterium]
MRATSQFILFVVTAFVIAVFYVPLGHSDYAGRWGDGTFGMQISLHGSSRIDAVAPDSPAAAAGVRVGDSALFSPLFLAWTRTQSPRAGQRESFTFVHPGGKRYRITMTAVPVSGFSLWDRITGVLAIVPATIFLGVAFALVFLRPSVMTWAFYAYAIGYFSTAPSFEYFSGVLPVGAYAVLAFFLSTFAGGFAVLPLLPFVLRFPDDDVKGVRRIVDATIWVAIALAFLAYSFEWYRAWTSLSSISYASVLDTWLPLGTFFLAALLLLQKFKHAPENVRQRFSFLVVGIIVSFVAYAVYFVPGVPVAVAQIAGYAVVVMPVSVAYAVLRHRVLDVKFVLNRAIAYGMVSLFVIAIVSLLDWLFSRVVSEQHLAVAGELVATIVIGLLLDRINKWIEGGVESVLFRGRRSAENFLRRAAAALPYATEIAAVTEGLVQIPDEALKLSAAAHYRRSPVNGRFEGAGTTKDTPMAPSGFDPNDLLVRMLQASENRVWLEELRAHLDSENAAIYVLAVPVSVRHELVSFTLYGAHRNGSQLDPEEVKLLEELAREASRSYDHIEAVRTRERYAHLITAASIETG